MSSFRSSQGGGERHEVLRELVKGLQVYTQWATLNVLEVGSFEGQSALVWSHASGEHFPRGGSVMCVDPWKQYHSEQQQTRGEVYTTMHAMLGDGSAYSSFLNNIKEEHPKVPIRHFRGTLLDALPELGENQFGLVYVDGDHRYSAVKQDIELVRDLVLPGGILCGDDLERQYTEGENCPELEYADTEDYISGFHPGVTKAVYEAFGTVWCKAGAWAVRKTGSTFIRYGG